MCIFTVITPIFILPIFPNITFIYGQIISWYKIIMALFIIIIASYGCISGQNYLKIILSAVTVNGICISYGVLSLGKFEPIIGAWPEEYGTYFMVICFVILMMKRNKEIIIENLNLTNNLKQEVDEKTKHLKLLITERGQLISELGHDMKSPLSSFSMMNQQIQLDNNSVDDNTKVRLQSIENKCNILSQRLHALQALTADSIVSINMESIDLNEFLLNFYKINKPVIELDGPDLVYNDNGNTCLIFGNEENISRVLENLIYNAADFTPMDGTISISLEVLNNFVHIYIEDNGCGISKVDLPKIFDRYFTTRKGKDFQGLGLAISRFIILDHGGTIKAESTPNKGTIFTIKLPLI